VAFEEPEERSPANLAGPCHPVRRMEDSTEVFPAAAQCEISQSCGINKASLGSFWSGGVCVILVNWKNK
jgi:hypothetical protein